MEILPNDGETLRETTVPLSFVFGRNNSATADVLISQTGKPEQIDPLQWQPFAVNSLSDAKYELLEDQVTRRYRIRGDQVFINPSFRKQVFPGNLIDYRTDNRELTDYCDKYTFNPIHFAAFVNRKLYEKDARPSYDALQVIVQQIINEMPAQNSQFNFLGPVQYHSYRHLHLLGVGNMGISLDELINGKSYVEKEMEKRTGVVYSSSQELFSIIMDFPEKLINETLSKQELSDRSYISSISYGKASVLLVESDADFVAVKSTINGIMWGWSLDDDQLKVRDALDVWCIYFDENGAHVSRGDYTLIRKAIDGIIATSTGIIPLNFKTNKLKDNSVGDMEVVFELP